jgi:hypothetical protein
VSLPGVAGLYIFFSLFVARFSTRGLDARHYCALKTGLPNGLPAIAFGSCIGFCAGRQLLSGLESRFFTMNTAESEYIAVVKCLQFAIWTMQ